MAAKEIVHTYGWACLLNISTFDIIIGEIYAIRQIEISLWNICLKNKHICCFNILF